MLLPMLSPVLLVLPSHLSVCNEEYNGKGGNRDGDGNKESNDEDVKGNGNGN